LVLALALLSNERLVVSPILSLATKERLLVKSAPNTKLGRLPRYKNSGLVFIKPLTTIIFKAGLPKLQKTN